MGEVSCGDTDLAHDETCRGPLFLKFLDNLVLSINDMFRK